MPRREIGKYATGDFCRYQTSSTQAGAAYSRDFEVATGAASRKEVRFASPARSEYFDEGIEDVWDACEVSLLGSMGEPLAEDKGITVMVIIDEG